MSKRRAKPYNGPTPASLEQQISEHIYECQDCFDEALMDCSYLDRVTTIDIPDSIDRERFDKAYVSEYTWAHLNPAGWNARIVERYKT